MDSLRGKVVLITGASSGIGAGTATYLAKLGSHLVLNGRNEANLLKTRQECIDCGLAAEQVITVIGSVEDTADCQRMVKAAVDHFGKLDVLVNNAASETRGTSSSLSVEQFDHQLHLNVRSVFQLSKFAMPHLERTRGNIVNISSIGAVIAVVDALAYSTSKAAVNHLTRNLALEVAAKGVRVNTVSPGVTVTEFHKRSGMPLGVYDQFLKDIADATPMKRVGYPEDVAKAVAFLASDLASFITGDTVTVDGGCHLGSGVKLPASTPSATTRQ